jgi:hypothetical protein
MLSHVLDAPATAGQLQRIFRDSLGSLPVNNAQSTI